MRLWSCWQGSLCCGIEVKCHCFQAVVVTGSICRGKILVNMPQLLCFVNISLHTIHSVECKLISMIDVGPSTCSFTLSGAGIGAVCG